MPLTSEPNSPKEVDKRTRHLAAKLGYKYGFVKCYKCDRNFIYGGDKYHAHLLFDHGIFLEPCKTFRAKVNASNIIEGFKVRMPIKKERVRRRWIVFCETTKLWKYDLHKCMLLK